jgi:hypothetical protein
LVGGGPPAQLDLLTVSDLKAAARSAGLALGGKKAELVLRIEHHFMK